MANEFTVPEDTELKAVAIHTPGANCRVAYTIYKLGEDAKNPEDGDMVAKLTVDHVYSGYHRSALVNPISLRKGERFSVVADISYVNKEGKRMHVRLANSGDKRSTKVVVNPGESFLMLDGEWTDLADVRGTDKIPAIEGDASKNEIYDVDNFPIKAFITDPLMP